MDCPYDRQPRNVKRAECSLINGIAGNRVKGDRRLFCVPCTASAAPRSVKSPIVQKYGLNSLHYRVAQKWDREAKKPDAVQDTLAAAIQRLKDAKGGGAVETAITEAVTRWQMPLETAQTLAKAFLPERI